MQFLNSIKNPRDLDDLSYEDLDKLAAEIREFLVSSVTRTGGHLGSNLGIVELTIAIHRAFNSPNDPILFDTGHQCYVHKLLTGRFSEFYTLRQENGISGYPNRGESEHDWIENSHASTVLSYAQGIASGLHHRGETDRRVVAVLGDGALTGGLAFEALNNIGHSQTPVIIVLNDNGRSYAPTISRLSLSVTNLRLHPGYVRYRERLKKIISETPLVGRPLYYYVHGITAALREVIEPHLFFETLGVRYVGPFDGHNIEQVESALKKAKYWNGPILFHVLTKKGKGYAPAEEDEVQRLHDVKAKYPVADLNTSSNGSAEKLDVKYVGDAPLTFTDAFSKKLVEWGSRLDNLVAITAAMPGPTGLLPFQERFPDRFYDVGIAEGHAITLSAGLCMGGMRPVVAIYSTFFSRAFDQANLDVGLHNMPVIFALDRAGVTGDDGPSHHGLLDMKLALSIPNSTIMAPSSYNELLRLFDEAINLNGPCFIRYPKTPSMEDNFPPGTGLNARKIYDGDGKVCILAIGKTLEAALGSIEELSSLNVKPSLYDVRVVRPCDEKMLADAASHDLIITLEDGFVEGGAGQFITSKLPSLEPKRVINLGIPTEYIKHAKPAAILSRYGLDPIGVAATIKAAILEVS